MHFDTATTTDSTLRWIGRHTGPATMGSVLLILVALQVLLAGGAQ
jgi:hypothetical protein